MRGGTGCRLARWRAGIDVAVDYLVAFWDRPCYDWWEEHVEHRHVSTLGAIRGGLVAVADLLDRRTAAAALEVAGRDPCARVGRGRGMTGTWPSGSGRPRSTDRCRRASCRSDWLPPARRLPATTLAAVAADLDVDGGVHRFTADVFYGGGQWMLLSALLGWNLAARRRTSTARCASPALDRRAGRRRR